MSAKFYERVDDVLQALYRLEDELDGHTPSESDADWLRILRRRWEFDTLPKLRRAGVTD